MNPGFGDGSGLAMHRRRRAEAGGAQLGRRAGSRGHDWAHDDDPIPLSAARSPVITISIILNNIRITACIAVVSKSSPAAYQLLFSPRLGPRPAPTPPPSQSLPCRIHKTISNVHAAIPSPITVVTGINARISHSKEKKTPHPNRTPQHSKPSIGKTRGVRRSFPNPENLLWSLRCAFVFLVCIYNHGTYMFRVSRA